MLLCSTSLQFIRLNMQPKLSREEAKCSTCVWPEILCWRLEKTFTLHIFIVEAHSLAQNFCHCVYIIHNQQWLSVTKANSVTSQNSCIYRFSIMHACMLIHSVCLSVLWWHIHPLWMGLCVLANMFCSSTCFLSPSGHKAPDVLEVFLVPWTLPGWSEVLAREGPSWTFSVKGKSSFNDYLRPQLRNCKRTLKLSLLTPGWANQYYMHHKICYM